MSTVEVSSGRSQNVEDSNATTGKEVAVSRKTVWILLALGLFAACVVLLVRRFWFQLSNKNRWRPSEVLFDERPMTLTLLSESPRIVRVDGFLSLEECRELMDLGEPKLRRSTVQGTGDGGSGGTNVISRERTSWTANLEKSQTKTLRRIEERAAILSGYPVSNIEPVQIVRYEPGQQYKRHWDYFVPGTEGAREALARGGQRRVTIFAYLNDVEEGGETHFTDINLKVSPKVGSAVLFHDCTPDGKEDSRTAHAGTPPKKGTKYGCNIWIRESAFK